MTSQRKKGAVLSYILMFAEIFSGLFFTPFLIRSFGQAEYGIYSLVSSITAYLYILDMGVGNSIVRYMAKFRVNKNLEMQRSLMAVTFIFYAGVGIIVIIIGVILNNNLQTIFGTGLTEAEIDRAKAMFSVTVLNAAITMALSPFNKSIIAFERFAFSKGADILKIILRVGISVIVLWLGGKGISIVLVNFVMTLLFGAGTIVYNIFYIKIKPSIRNIEKAFIIEIFSYSVVVFVQMIATQLNSMVDQVLMGIMIPSAATLIGIYAIGAQFSSYLQSFASSINSILMPGIVRLVETTKQSKAIQDEMVKIGRMVFMLLSLVYIVFLVFGGDFVDLWAGHENHEAYYVGIIIMLPMVFMMTQSVGSQIMWALNRHKVQAILQIIAALANVVLTMVMIKWNPIIGASIATCITYFLGCVLVQNIVFTKYLGISMLSYYISLFKGIAPSLCLTIVIGVAIKFMLPTSGLIGFLVHCLIMVVAYAVLMYTKGLNVYEKNLLKGFIIYKNFGGKKK